MACRRGAHAAPGPLARGPPVRFLINLFGILELEECTLPLLSPPSSVGSDEEILRAFMVNWRDRSIDY